VPSEEVGRGPGADPEGEPLDYDENGEPIVEPPLPVPPADDQPDEGHDIAGEAGPLQTEFGTKEAADSMTSTKFKGD
jgi:hypothetical protein